MPLRLDAPITEGGRPLKDMIHRMRNEMMVHTNLDFDEYGPALVFIGRQGPEWAAALDGSAHATQAVASAIGEESAQLVREAGMSGSLVNMFDRAAYGSPSRR